MGVKKTPAEIAAEMMAQYRTAPVPGLREQLAGCARGSRSATRASLRALSQSRLTSTASGK
jgi:hypothetical protein